jgi:hypothetical protein
MTLVLFLGASGKMILEKNLKKKSRDTVPLKRSGQILSGDWITYKIYAKVSESGLH